MKFRAHNDPFEPEDASCPSLLQKKQERTHVKGLRWLRDDMFEVF